MGHQHSVYDADTHFVIDPITREITNAGSKKKILQQYDHNSEVFSFELDRYVEEHDMSLCNRVEIHYINLSSSSRTISFSSVYEVDDVKVIDGDKILFTWTISGNSTQYAGSLNFLISFACTEGDTVTYRWNTGINKDITIASGMNNGEEVVRDYDDILLQWYNKLFGIGETVEANLLKVSEEQQTIIKETTAEMLDTISEDYNDIVETVNLLEGNQDTIVDTLTVIQDVDVDTSTVETYCPSCVIGESIKIYGRSVMGESRLYFFTAVPCEAGDVFYISGIAHAEYVYYAYINNWNQVLAFGEGQGYLDEVVDEEIVAPKNATKLYVFTLLDWPVIKKVTIAEKLADRVNDLSRGYSYPLATNFNDFTHGVLTEDGDITITEDATYTIVSMDIIQLKKNTKITFTETTDDLNGAIDIPATSIIYRYSENGEKIGLLAKIKGFGEYVFTEDCHVRIGSSSQQVIVTISYPEPVLWQEEIDNLSETVAGLTSGEAYLELENKVEDLSDEIDNLKSGSIINDLETKINELDEELTNVTTSEEYKDLTELKGYLDENQDAINTLQTAIQNSNGIIVSDTEPENYPYLWFNTAPGQTKIATLNLSTDGDSEIVANVEGVSYSVDNATANKGVTSENEYDFTIL